MMRIRRENGFDVLPDGSIVARYGRQSSCATGIAQIHFKIELIDRLEVQFELVDKKDDYVFPLPDCIFLGIDVPKYLRDSTLAGVTEAFTESSISSQGIKFTLISAFVHSMDAYPHTFEFLGKLSFFAWSSTRINPSKLSWKFDESYKICKELYGWSD
jgi:hypothetical protein